MSRDLAPRGHAEAREGLSVRGESRGGDYLVFSLGGDPYALPIGVITAEGDFARGAVVACRTRDGREVARGLVNYAANDTRRIVRHASTDIEELLGYTEEPELIHRDNLVLIS